MLTGRGVMVNDYATSPHAMAEFVPFTSRLLAAPLMAGGRALGVMTAGRGPGAAPFSDEDLSTLADFATQAAVALEHARLFDEATRNAAQYQALLEVSGVVSSTLEVDRVLDLVVDRCQALLGVAALGVSRLDRSTGLLIYERGRGLSTEFLGSLRIRLGEGTTGGAAERREPVWTNDILHDPSVTLSPATRVVVEREGYRAVLSVPLVSKGEVLGALSAYWWEPHTPSAGEISVMSALAGQAAVALDNARLFAQERDRKASLSSLLEINKKIGALAAPEALLASIAEEAARLLEVDNAGFRLLDGDDLVLAGLFGTAVETMVRPRIRVGESLSGKVIASGHALMCELEGADMVADHRAAARRLGYTHYLGVPLLVGERPIGVLVFRGRRALHRARAGAGRDLRGPGRHRDRPLAPLSRGLRAGGAHAGGGRAGSRARLHPRRGARAGPGRHPRARDARDAGSGHLAPRRGDRSPALRGGTGAVLRSADGSRPAPPDGRGGGGPRPRWSGARSGPPTCSRIRASA